MIARPRFNIPGISRKLAAILLPCLLGWLVWVEAISPFLALSESYQDQRHSLLDRIAADERQIALGPAWREELAQLRRAVLRDQGARTELTPALAAAGLQNDIQTMLAQAGGQVLSVQILPSTDLGQYETVSVQISMSLPLVALPDFLKRVETHMPFMFIQAAAFQAPDAMVGQATSYVGTSANLDVTILAFRRP